MECDEVEDTNSLLSLSQTFLQPDSSSSTISLSTSQLQNWSTLTHTSADVGGQFSPISPANSYSTNTGHTLTENDANFRFYGSRPTTHQSTARSSVSGLFNRSGNCNIGVSISNNFLPANRAGNNFSTGHMTIDTTSSSCYEQASTHRSNGNFYGDKDTGYSNRDGLNDGASSHQTEASNALAGNFSQTSSHDEHSILGLSSTSDGDGKLGIRNVPLDQKLFDSRPKQDYSKDLTNLYDQSTDKPLQSTEITMSFDRRDGNSFDNSFEFPSDSRDFTTSARLDSAQILRGTQEQEYHQAHKYSSSQLGENNVLSCSVPLDSKRVSSSYINFGIGSQVEDAYGRLSNPQKKAPTSFNPPLNDLATDLEPVFSQGYHTDFGGHQKYLLDSHRSFGTDDFKDGEDAGRFNVKDQTNSREVNSKWNGRPRVHRKMARLLGSEEHRDYSQEADTSNSHKTSFSKSFSSLEQDAQNKNSYQQNLHRDLAGNSRAFLTMEEELDLRTNHHQQRNFASRRDENLENQSVQRELGLLQTASTFSFDSNPIAASLHKDNSSSILTGQPFIPPGQLDLDFHSSLSLSQPQKDLDLNQHFGLQVSKDFGLETSHTASNQDDLTFDHTGNTHHVNQTELSLPDSLSMVPHAPELSFEAYFNSASDRDFTSTSDRDFNPTSERDLSFGRKFPVTRDLNYVTNATVADFNIEDYMNSQTQRDLSQSYFRPDLPQDMTIYQKTAIDKTPLSDTLTQFKSREKGSVLTVTKDKQGEISELQKELTKTSTKESMRGIRTPRDIHRAMEIFQGLQEDEREEERRKKQQQRQQQLQGLISNPKKSFQNKHNINSLSLSDQQFLGSSGSFIEDQSVTNFLNHSHLMMSDQTQENQQIMQPYQAFPPSVDVDMTSTLSGKRDLHQNLVPNMTPELDYHFFKKLTCSTSIKSNTMSQGQSFSTNATNLASILADNVTQDSGIQFQVNGIHFQPQSDLEDMSTSLLSNGSQTTLELNRQKNEMAFMELDSQPVQQIISDKPTACNDLSDPVLHVPMEVSQVTHTKLGADVLNMSRKNLYDMMKREQFCDAVLSISKQTLKVHLVVLCSMSQYLTALLQKMKPVSPSYAAKNSSSLSLSFTSQTTRNNSVLLVVNCDGIKSSSMMAFLLYIYLGQAEINENNVLDIYILACSLRVPALKDLCKEFMWQAHIPNDQIKVPELIVSIQRLEMQDKVTMTEIGTEDRATNTSRLMSRAEVATQTDRSTSEAGEGGQEEWVMLKKTKQKTVSPSKSRLIGKSLTGIDSPINFKTGKKGWLSPKRRYKTENQIEDKSTEKEVDILTEKEGVTVKEILDILPVIHVPSNSDRKSQLTLSSVAETESCGTLQEILQQNSEILGNKSHEILISVNKPAHTPKKHARTTVEIAAAAAAAKVATHSYGTRTAKGVVKFPVSYASLALGLERKKSFANPKEKTAMTMSKKKDFIKSNSHTDFSLQSQSNSLAKSDSFAVMLKDSFGADNANSQNESNPIKPVSITTEAVPESIAAAASEQVKANGDAFKHSVKQPFKKSIVHRSRSEDRLSKNLIPLAPNQPSKAEVGAGNDSDFMDSYLIDSIVNTIECDNAEVDFQKVINDLDTLSKSPLLTTTSTSISSTSLTSPLKSPTVLLSTPDSTSPPKSRTTPQGFRKRLIHQINAEKNGPSPPKSISSKNTPPAVDSVSKEIISTLPASGTFDDSTPASLTVVSSSASTSLTTQVALTASEACQNNCGVDQLTVNYKNVSDITSDFDKDQLPPEFTETVDELALTLYSLEGETDLMLDGKMSSFSSMTDIDLGLKYDQGSQFSHKIFQPKKRPKSRKSIVADTEGTVVKSKVKKLIIGDTEGATSKPKLRKCTGSDTEGGTRGAKVKKNVCSENEGALAKVRPPPKKRAKMELALLKAGDLDKHGVCRGDNFKTEAEELLDDSRREKAPNFKAKTNSSPFGLKDDLKLIGWVKLKKSEEDVKAKLQKSPKKQEKIILLSDPEIKLARLLEDMTKNVDLKTKKFTCKLCQMKIRSACRVVKHLRLHKLPPEEGLQNIVIGEKGDVSNPEDCDICGYKTKDTSYHYMHMHKYFKHGVPLPLGWSTEKCEMCGKEYFSKFQLKEHMKSHDESHDYVCWHCGQSFKMRNNLNSHVFHKHSNIRKHECKACGKAFKTWTQLKVHVRSHTGERPFACVDCNHRSTTQGNMRFHLVTHGYSKEKILEIMKKICQNSSDMNPETLNQIMINIAAKVKAEQQIIKEKKRKRKSNKKKANEKNVDNEGHKNTDLASPDKDIPPDGSTGIRKAQKKPTEHKTTLSSKFAGSHIKRLLTQPLSKLKPPKFIPPHLMQTSVFNSGKNSGGNQENSHSQVVSGIPDSSTNSLSMLLQQQTQKQETTGISGAVFFIQLCPGDQHPLLQQPQRHQQQSSLSTMMGYTVIPSQLLPGQTESESSINPATSLRAPVLSASNVITSGLNVTQSEVHTVQLVQADGLYTSGTFPETSQRHDMLQDVSATSLQLSDSKTPVTDTSAQEVNAETLHAMLSANGAPNGPTTIMLLPNVANITTHEQSMQQQQLQTIFSYPSLIPLSQSVLLPVTPGVQILPPNLETSNFGNFSMTMPASEEVVTLNMSQQNYENVGTETKKILVETQEETDISAMSVAIGNRNSNSGIVSYTMVTCDEDNRAKDENKMLKSTEVPVCVESVSTFG